jgi:hypothetical protein
VRVFERNFALEDAIDSHTCSLEASTRVTNGIPLRVVALLPVDTVISVQTLKVFAGLIVPATVLPTAGIFGTILAQVEGWSLKDGYLYARCSFFDPILSPWILPR